jgi:hypothetical protein
LSNLSWWLFYSIRQTSIQLDNEERAITTKDSTIDVHDRIKKKIVGIELPFVADDRSENCQLNYILSENIHFMTSYHDNEMFSYFTYQ